MDSLCRPVNATQLKLVSEHEWSVFLAAWLQQQGYLVHYERQSGFMGAEGRWRGSGPKGKPDLTIVKGGQVWLAELKKENGSLTPDQRAWRDELGERGRVWKPRDWPTIKFEFGQKIQPNPS
jgi:hypothetical protein